MAWTDGPAKLGAYGLPVVVGNGLAHSLPRMTAAICFRISAIRASCAQERR
jgi:hypothetical protein